MGEHQGKRSGAGGPVGHPATQPMGYSEAGRWRPRQALRLALAVFVAKLVRWLTRVLNRGHGGTSLPGRIVLSLAPDAILLWMQQLRRGVVVVTGTNGKTSTANLIRLFLRRQGYRVVANASGANLLGGVATALALATDPWGRLRSADYAVIEADERISERIVAAAGVKARALVVTNILRDQLDRLAEPELVRQAIGRAASRLPATARLLLNADDPGVVQLATSNLADSPVSSDSSDRRAPSSATTVFYGLGEVTTDRPGATAGLPRAEAAMPGGEAASVDTEVRDSETCPACGSQLSFALRFYSHLGFYECPVCGWRRPEPAWTADATLVRCEPGDDPGWAVAVHVPDHTEPVRGVLPGEAAATASASLPDSVRVKLAAAGVHQLYNLLAAVATVAELTGRLPLQAGEIIRPQVFGRMEKVALGAEWGHRELVLALTKNPTGANQNLRTLAGDQRVRSVMFVLNDLAADGRDISWIWDVDWSPVVARTDWTLVATGRRAAEAALCWHYAGVATERIQVQPSLETAMRTAVESIPPGSRCLALATYTGLLQFRHLLATRHWVSWYWEQDDQTDPEQDSGLLSPLTSM
ncbi:MAG: DUF1727 domain-containing protein [Limnochordaceae bacterium]|nr:DUF1727 domain-containing protein [Limnochordaceae bacterium]